MDEAVRRSVDQLQAADLAQHQRLRRQRLAKESGLELPEDPMILGSEINVTHNHPAPTPPPATGKAGDLVRRLVTGGALLAAGAAGAIGLSNVLPKTPAVAPTQQASPPPASTSPPSQEWRIRWWVEDGEVKTSVEQPP